MRDTHTLALPILLSLNGSSMHATVNCMVHWNCMSTINIGITAMTAPGAAAAAAPAPAAAPAACPPHPVLYQRHPWNCCLQASAAAFSGWWEATSACYSRRPPARHLPRETLWPGVCRAQNKLTYSTWKATACLSSVSLLGMLAKGIGTMKWLQMWRTWKQAVLCCSENQSVDLVCMLSRGPSSVEVCDPRPSPGPLVRKTPGK